LLDKGERGRGEVRVSGWYLKPHLFESEPEGFSLRVEDRPIGHPFGLSSWPKASPERRREATVE
jgi:hypothetical protein